MKIIDLLNKIANGEQPSHIRIYNRDWYWNNYDGYVTKNSLSTTPDAQIYLFSSYRLDLALDKEVEIIEEEQDIEEITIRDNTLGFPSGYWTARNMDKAFAIKINKLIKEINKLKNK